MTATDLYNWIKDLPAGTEFMPSGMPGHNATDARCGIQERRAIRNALAYGLIEPTGQTHVRGGTVQREYRRLAD